MSNGNQPDPRTRKFAEVVPPQPTRLEKVSKRGAPSLPDLGRSSNLWEFGSDGVRGGT